MMRARKSRSPENTPFDLASRFRKRGRDLRSVCVCVCVCRTRSKHTTHRCGAGASAKLYTTRTRTSYTHAVSTPSRLSRFSSCSAARPSRSAELPVDRRRTNAFLCLGSGKHVASCEYAATILREYLRRATVNNSSTHTHTPGLCSPFPREQIGDVAQFPTTDE